MRDTAKQGAGRRRQSAAYCSLSFVCLALYISDLLCFAKDFLEKRLDISPLRMPLVSNLVQSRQSIRGTSPKDRFGGLHPVFADSLPDHWGNSIFRKWAENHKISMKNVTGVDLLYVRLEYAYYKMCCDAGIRMKHSELPLLLQGC